MKRFLLGAGVLGAVMAAHADGDSVETRAYYSTNPGNAVGKAATITIDGEFTDWSDDMIVATCGANDMATAFYHHGVSSTVTRFMPPGMTTTSISPGRWSTPAMSGPVRATAR